MGLALLVIVLFQSVLGCTIHWVRLPGKNVSGRTVAHYGHMVLGLGTVVVGFFTVWTGIWSEMGLRAYAVPGWKWKIGWIVVVCVSVKVPKCQSVQVSKSRSTDTHPVLVRRVHRRLCPFVGQTPPLQGGDGLAR